MHIEARASPAPPARSRRRQSPYRTGVAPVITLSPTSLTFSGTQGDPIAARQSPSPTPAMRRWLQRNRHRWANASLFNQTNNCPSSLATSASCTVSVSFVAQTAGYSTQTSTSSARPQRRLGQRIDDTFGHALFAGTGNDRHTRHYGFW